MRGILDDEGRLADAAPAARPHQPKRRSARIRGNRAPQEDLRGLQFPQGQLGVVPDARLREVRQLRDQGHTGDRRRSLFGDGDGAAALGRNPERVPGARLQRIRKDVVADLGHRHVLRQHPRLHVLLLRGHRHQGPGFLLWDRRPSEAAPLEDGSLEEAEARGDAGPDDCHVRRRRRQVDQAVLDFRWVVPALSLSPPFFLTCVFSQEWCVFLFFFGVVLLRFLCVFVESSSALWRQRGRRVGNCFLSFENYLFRASRIRDVKRNAEEKKKKRLATAIVSK